MKNFIKKVLSAFNMAKHFDNAVFDFKRDLNSSQKIPPPPQVLRDKKFQEEVNEFIESREKHNINQDPKVENKWTDREKDREAYHHRLDEKDDAIDAVYERWVKNGKVDSIFNGKGKGGRGGR